MYPTGKNTVVEQCLLGEATGEVPGLLYYVNVGPTADNTTIRDNDLRGLDDVGGAGTFINMQTSGPESNPTVASNLVIERNLFIHAAGDYIKVHGAGFKISRNVFDVVSCYPPGTPDLISGIAFAQGRRRLNSNGYLFTAKLAGTLAEPPANKTDDANWTSWDPHNDLITVRGAVGSGDHLIVNNYFKSQVGARSPGLTQQIRYIRNTGTPTPSGRVRVIGNVFEAWDGFYPFAAGGIRDHVSGKSYDTGEYCSENGLRYVSLTDNNQGNTPSTSPVQWRQVYDIQFDGPVVFQHNWMGQGSNGAYYANGAMSDVVTVWDDNLDWLTGAAVPAPDYSVNKPTPEPKFGSAGSPPVFQSYGPFTGFDITPNAYGPITLPGGTSINACAIAVGGQVVCYFPESGAPVAVPGRGVTLGDLGGDKWRLSLAAGAPPAKATVVSGGALVVEKGAVASPTVIGILGQSQMEYLTNPGGTYGQIPDPADIPTTPNVTVWTDTTSLGAGSPVKTVVTPQAVADGKINPAIANWSVFWARVAPGRYFHVVDLAVPGTSRMALAEQNHVEARWPAFTAMLAAVRAEGLEFDAIIENWQVNDESTAKTFPEEWAPFYFGQRWGGGSFTLGNPNPDSAVNPAATIDNCLWDIASPADVPGRGVFARARTKLYFSGWPSFSGPAAGTPEMLNYSDNSSSQSKTDRPARDRLDEFLADSRVSTFAGSVVGSAHIALMDGGGNHPDRTDPDGQILMSIGYGAAALAAAGLPVSDPTISGVTMGAGGAYADVAVNLPNGGDLTTISDLENRAPIVNPPPHHQPVMGFEIRRVGQADNQRRPVYNTGSGAGYPSSHKGTVAIQDSGSGSPRRGVIRITPTVPFVAGDMLEFDRGDASASLLKPRDTDAKLYLYQPLETVPSWRDPAATYPFPGIAVKPQPPTLVIGAVATPDTRPSNTVRPAVSGAKASGSLLSTTYGSWDGTQPIAFEVEWERNGVAIPGSVGATYRTTQADVGATITSRVTASNSVGEDAAVSPGFGPIVAVASGAVPVNTVPPSVTGSTAVGDTLSCTTGNWTGDPPITFTRQWKRGLSAISGANAPTYQIQPADDGLTIRCSVFATNAAGGPIRQDSNVVNVGGAQAPAFFTVTEAGPYYRDPQTVPAGTTDIVYEARMRLLNPGGASNMVAAQSSTGCDLAVSFPSAQWQCSVEDATGAKMISGAERHSPVPSIGLWHTVKFDASFTRGNAIISVDGTVVDTIPFSATPAPADAFFQTGRLLSFFANANGQTGIATGGVGAVEVEYIQATLTTGGTTSLRHRVDASNYDTSPWLVG